MERSASDTVRVVRVLLRTQFPGITEGTTVTAGLVDAYNQADPDLRGLVQRVIRLLGFDPSGLLGALRQVTLPEPTIPARKPRIPKAAGMPDFMTPRKQVNKIFTGTIPQSERLPIIQEALRLVSDKTKKQLSWLTPFDIEELVDIESGWKPLAVAPNGLFFGLTQMGRPAWQDAMSWDSRLVVHPHAQSWRDPLINLRAALAFWAMNDKVVSKTGVRLDNIYKLYAAHQQGATGFVRLFQSRISTDAIIKGRSGRPVVDEQSPPSRVYVARAVTDARRVA